MGILTLTLLPLPLRLLLTDTPGDRRHHIGEIRLLGGITMQISIPVAAMAAPEITSRWAFLPHVGQFVIMGVGSADEREAAARITNHMLSCSVEDRLVADFEELGFRQAKAEGGRVLHKLALAAAAPAARGAVTTMVELPE